MQEISGLTKDLLAIPWISYSVSQKKNRALSHLSVRMAKVALFCLLKAMFYGNMEKMCASHFPFCLR